MKRSVAEKVLDKVREMLANRRTPEQIEYILQDNHNIPPLTKCNGEAHDNIYIDHCGVCAPRWGLLGERLKIT